MSTSLRDFTHTWRTPRRLGGLLAAAAGTGALVAALLALSPAPGGAPASGGRDGQATVAGRAAPAGHSGLAGGVNPAGDVNPASERAPAGHGGVLPARRWGSGALLPSGGRENVGLHLAGYVASGRPFQYAQAVIEVPGDRPCAGGSRLYVALAGRSAAHRGIFARAGLLCGPRWRGFVEVKGLLRPQPVLMTFPLPGAAPGVGIFASVAYSAGAAQATVVLPSGATVHRSAPMGQLAFTEAQALADWAATPARPGAPTLLTQFRSGEFVTEAGARGVFAGPWTAKGDLSWRRWAVDADVITNGARRPAAATVVSAPSRLWTDGTQGVYGATGDAFGVWLYP